MTFLKKLRDAAMACSNVDYREQLKRAADSVEFAIREVYEVPTEETMIYLNGQWAVAKKVLDNMPSEADPQPPVSGDAEPARLAA